MAQDKLILRQLFDHDTYTYTYLIADPVTREAALIDTVKENKERDLQLVRELGLKLKYVMDTHVHADHVTGAGEIREATGVKSVLGKGAGVGCVDLEMGDGSELNLGNIPIKVIETPGHTNACVSYYVDGMVFTGDALFVRGCGRTDFQSGSSEKLYHSITEKLFKLPPETMVYPAHDYRGRTASTIAEEREFNPRMGGGKTLEEFAKIMKELNLASPKNIQMALPANLACGRS
jgi:sulfur dioxygenase